MPVMKGGKRLQVTMARHKAPSTNESFTAMDANWICQLLCGRWPPRYWVTSYPCGNGNR